VWTARSRIAYRECNEKRDKFTNLDALERLCTRNEQIVKQCRTKWSHHAAGPTAMCDYWRIASRMAAVSGEDRNSAQAVRGNGR
jgi:hypothetical protein